MLSPGQYREARLGFLIARAIDGFEDLSANKAEAEQGLTQLLGYLRGGSAPPMVPQRACGKTRSDQVEIAVIENSACLRNALTAMPCCSRDRLLQFADDLAKAVMSHFDDRRTRAPDAKDDYAEHILGRVTRFSMDVMGLRYDSYTDWRAVGQVVQSANDLRDLKVDRNEEGGDRDADADRLELLLSTMAAAPLVPTLLSELTYPAISRSRAACAYLAVTTIRFFLKNLEIDPPYFRGTALTTALKCLFSDAAYRDVVLDFEQVLLAIASNLKPVFENSLSENTLVPPSRNTLTPPCGRKSRLQASYEDALACHFKNPADGVALRRAIGLARFAYRIMTQLPRQPIDPTKDQKSYGYALMMSDYILACALGNLKGSANKFLQRFAGLLAQIAENAEFREIEERDCAEIATFIKDALDMDLLELPIPAASGIYRKCNVSRKLARLDRMNAVPGNDFRRAAPRRRIEGLRWNRGASRFRLENAI